MNSAKKLKLFVYLSFFVHLAGGLAIYFYYHPIRFAPKAAGERQAADLLPDETGLAGKSLSEDPQSASPGAFKAEPSSSLRASPSGQPPGQSKALSSVKRRKKSPKTPAPPAKKAAVSLEERQTERPKKKPKKSQAKKAGQKKKKRRAGALSGESAPSSSKSGGAKGLSLAAAKAKSSAGRDEPSAPEAAAAPQKEPAGAASASEAGGAAGEPQAAEAMSQKEADELLDAAEALVSDKGPEKSASSEKINLNGLQLKEIDIDGPRAGEAPAAKPGSKANAAQKAAGGSAQKSSQPAAASAAAPALPDQKSLKKPRPELKSPEGGAKPRSAAGAAAKNSVSADSSKAALLAADKIPEGAEELAEEGKEQKTARLELNDGAELVEKENPRPAGRNPDRGMDNDLENMELVEEEGEKEAEEKEEAEEEEEGEDEEDEDDEGAAEESAPAASGRPEPPPLAETKPEAKPPFRDFSELRQKRGNPPLAYPEIARREKMQGSVSVIYFVGPGGLVDQIQLKNSSGHAGLDNFVLRTLVRYKFLPGQEGWVSHKVNFQLEGVEKERLRLRER